MCSANALSLSHANIVSRCCSGTLEYNNSPHACTAAAKDLYACGVLLFVLLAWAINSSDRIQAAGETDLTGPVKESVARAGETREIGKALFSEHILPFEFTSILIFIAIIGAIYLTRTRKSSGPAEKDEKEEGAENPQEAGA